MRSSRTHRAGRAARTSAVALSLVAGLVVLATLAGCASASADSGVVGAAIIGPTQPVAQPGVPDTRPYSAELSIAPKAGLHLRRPVVVKSDENGNFKVNLAPGTYVITSSGTGMPPTLKPIEVVVQPHQFAEVVADFDSGIR